MKTKNIDGNKIRLRDWRFEDVDIYRKWLKPGAPWQALDGPYYKTSEDESDRIADTLKKRLETDDFPTPRMRLVIADRTNNELIGMVSCYWESQETNWLCCGLTIFDHTRWGQGIGYEALGLWIDYLFENYPLIVRMDMRTWSGNHGLIHLAKKLKFTQEACFRKARIVDGKYYDGLGFGILKSEWEELHPEGFAARLRK